MNLKSLFSLRSITLVVFSVLLFSFTTKKGGDSFSILLNNKVLVEQYVLAKKPIETIALSQSVSAETLNVNYSHCGKIGTDRAVSIRNSENKILKQWNFQNVKENIGPTMGIPVKDILALQKENAKTVKLYYASSEMPEGRLLANIDLRNDIKVSMR